MSVVDMGQRPIDGRLRGKSNPTLDELDRLRRECRDHNVSEETKLILARLASYPPLVRLVVNLKTVVGLMVNGPIFNVLREGLLPEERAALVELDMRGLSTHAREIAHGLLNIHERWAALKRMRSVFEEAKKAKDAYLIPIAETEAGDSEARDADSDD